MFQLLINAVLMLLVNVTLLLLVNYVVQLLVNVVFQLMCIRCPTAVEFSFSSVVNMFFN